MKQISRIGRFAASAAEIGAVKWNSCANPTGASDPHPFTRHEFVSALEDSGSATLRTGWTPCHFVMECDGAIEGLLPLYLKTHSQGEYVFDHSWADAFERAGGSYYPKLQCSIPFTPVTGPRLLAHTPEGGDGTRRVLLSAATEAVSAVRASSLHITFMEEAEWRLACASGYLGRTDQQFHWINPGYSAFDDFLADLSSAKRKTLRKERAAVRDAGITFEWCSGRTLTENRWDEFYGFYTETGSRKWGRPYLTRDFFSLIGANMPDAILLVIARMGARPIAGALNFIGERTLFGRNWGASEFVPFLHFETCYYQAIEFAIASGLRKVEAGAQGAHKLLRGYRPVETRSAHFILHEGLRGAVDNYLRHERDAVAGEMRELTEHLPFRRGG